MINEIFFGLKWKWRSETLLTGIEDFGKVYAYTISPSLKVIKDKKKVLCKCMYLFLSLERDQNVPFSVKSSTYSIYFI